MHCRDVSLCAHIPQSTQVHVALVVWDSRAGKINFREMFLEKGKA